MFRLWVFATVWVCVCHGSALECSTGSSCDRTHPSRVEIGNGVFCCPGGWILEYRFVTEDENVKVACTCDAVGSRKSNLSDECLAQPEGGYFSCSDSKNVIPSDRVNDNYCDCKDGSDEPKTSACAGHGLFMCGYPDENLLASSKVGDNICDCCDGLDELQGLCSNTCKEKFYLKKLARKQYIEGITLGVGKLQAQLENAVETKETGTAKEEARRMNLTLVRLHQDFLERCIAEGIPKRSHFRVEELRKTVEEAKECIGLAKFSQATLMEVSNQVDCGEPGLSDAESNTEQGRVSAAERLLEMALRCNRLQELPDILEAYRVEAQEEPCGKLANLQRRVWSFNPRECEVKSRIAAKRKEIAERKAFIALPAKCEKTLTGKYNYTICPQTKIYQGSVLLGEFKKLTLLKTRRTKEDYITHPATIRLDYSGGSTCNNAPREVRLFLYCNASTAVVRVEEPQTCRYEAHMNSPGGCYEGLIDIFKLDESTLKRARQTVEWDMWYERNFTALLLLFAMLLIGLFVLLLCCALSKYARGDVNLEVKTPSAESSPPRQEKENSLTPDS